MTVRDHTARLLQVLTSSARRGAEIFAEDLGTALAAAGEQVRTVALSPATRGAALDVEVLGGAHTTPSTVVRLRRAMREARVTVAHGSRAVAVCSVASIGLGRGFVYRNIGDPRYWATTRARRIRVSTYLRRADTVVALWDESAQAIHELYGVPTDRIRVIPKGVPAARFPPVTPERRADARARFALRADAPIVLSLGALSPEKNVEAAIHVAAAIPECQVVLAGDGPDRPRLEALARRLAPGRVHLLGVVEDPAAVLAAADCLVLPSSTEGMPGAVIEAGFTGIPAVATRVGAVHEMVVDGITGFVVAPGDLDALVEGVRAALAEPVEMGGRAREHCLERYEIGVVATRWAGLLDEISR